MAGRTSPSYDSITEAELRAVLYAANGVQATVTVKLNGPECYCATVSPFHLTDLPTFNERLTNRLAYGKVTA